CAERSTGVAAVDRASGRGAGLAGAGLLPILRDPHGRGASTKLHTAAGDREHECWRCRADAATCRLRAGWTAGQSFGNADWRVLRDAGRPGPARGGEAANPADAARESDHVDARGLGATAGIVVALFAQCDVRQI